MRSCRLLLGLSLLIAGCDHREQTIVKSDMEGTVLPTLPGASNTSTGGTSSIDDPNFVPPDGPKSTVSFDPLAITAAATRGTGTTSVPDWERLSVLSLGLQASDGNFDFAR